ncbi:EamA family transporter [Leptolyngbya sp. O-77]|uniref:EamA family transporter n=1 Tax=Leptolyngbya sp. O-77 TaxID=1080068 RepID=UPI001CECDF15|nr:EamA family transporter [Leptolyngbya sp. O-77]
MSNTETNPGNGTPPSKGVEQILQDVTQDLRSLQQDVVSSLSQDISRLQAERSRLQNEIEKLQSQQQALQSQHQIFLTQQQIAQQKLWAKQLAQTMAGYLYNLLAQRLSQLPGEAVAPNLPPAAQSANSQQALSLLDATLSQTLASLQSDLNVYHSGLSQQIDRMQTLEQQGEALLEALVSRLNQQLQAVGTVSPSQPAAYSTTQTSSTLTSEPVSSPARPGLPEPSLFNPSAPSPGGLTTTGGEAAPNGYAGRASEPPAPPNVSPDPASLDSGSPPIAPTPRPTPTVTVSSNPFSVSTLAGIVLAGLLILAGVAMLGKLIAALLGGGTGLSVGTMPLLLLTLAAGLAYWVWQQGRAPRRLSGRTAGRFSKGSLRESPKLGSLAGGLPHLAQPQVGLVLILLSTLALSLHNVVVGIIGGQTSIFGLFSLPRSITLDSFNDSLLVLWLRMVVVVPVMVAIARWLYPNAWRDIRSFALSRDRALQGYVVGSGACLFLSQVFIYIAIAATGPGVAVTILFMYPLILVPLAWLLFRDRPTPLRWVVLFAILSGVVLTALPRLMQATNVSTNGIFFAILSGIFFALYLITMQVSFGKKLHPVPVSVVQFFTIFVLANIMLLLLGVEEPPDHLLGLLLGGLVLGTLTLLGYLLNNLGVRLLGAARASIISASGPVLTALLAYLITPSERTQLQPVQWIGIVVVTLGVLGLSFERMRMQNKTAPAAK